MSQVNRLARTSGSLVNHDRSVSFTFDGTRMSACAGDTLASALLANGVRLVGRSFKYHRPRGIFTAGSEEPNALVELRKGAALEPNTRATVTEVFDGLEAKSQNRFPSLKWDVMAVNDLASDFLTAGFYYKTFMWPKAFWEKLYEPMIRRSAGLGSLSGAADPDAYDKGFLHCDVLVIGSGPSGLTAALTAARSGLQVILADEDFEFGGRLNSEALTIDDAPASVWKEAVLAELASLPNVRLMKRTTVYGAYDHGIFGALERVSDHLATTPDNAPRQILWRITARSSILCAGATERGIAFANNDRPGIMLGGAVRTYANRYDVTPGKRLTVFTSCDDGHRTALDLQTRGVEIAAVIDVRQEAAALGDYPLFAASTVTNSKGRHGLSALEVREANGVKRWIETDCLALSGGWNPNVHLTCHQRGRPVWNNALNTFVPGESLPQGMLVAGAAKGLYATGACLQSGAEAAAETVTRLGGTPAKLGIPATPDSADFAQCAFWHVTGEKGRAWLDLQNDVTVKDVKLARQEGFTSVEHLKRYTTLGMATDQGKTANVPALAIMAELEGKTIEEYGSTTIFRPPYTPIPLGALAGRSRGKEFRPTRVTPTHDWAEEQGAVFVEVGNWMRAQYFPKPGETHWRESVDREALAVRSSVGLCDVTTLGKVDVQGADAAAFLNRVYCNGFAKLAVGKTRYGLMLREDGIVMDDGTAARLAEDHFVVTTTTANAVSVFRHMEFCRQCLWPEMDVQLISTTDAWAQIAVAGPKSRDLLKKIVDPDHDISNEAFPFMACRELTVCGGVKARLFRISFSGELAFEIAVPSRYGDGLMRALMSAGEEYGVTPYGTEALAVLRIEKGHAAGSELNGQTSAHNLGLGRMVSQKKDSIGTTLSKRPDLCREDGLQLVGFQAANPETPLPSGAHLFASGARHTMASDQGWLTSACYSPHLKSYIALGFLKDGAARMGETIEIANPLEGTNTTAKVVSPHFIDPDGERLRV